MSHQWKFDVYWPNVCSCCSHPLNITIHLIHDVNNYEIFWKRFFNFKKLKPLDFYRNKMYYRIVNLKARRVCKWCYENKPYKIGVRDLMNRETTGRSLAPRSKSLSIKEVYNWFESFNRYVRRHDADDFIYLS